jgi:DNA-binding transcriptional LysR family regulator
MNNNPITLEALEILDSIDRRGSFAKAAEELNKATSALSYGVQKLEDLLGVSIFVRQGRRSVLTPAGRLVLEEGRTILEATARLADRAKEIATGWEPRLRVGVESIVNQQIFFDILATFQNDHPNLEIDVSETVLNGGWEALEQHRIDLVIGAPGPAPLHKGFRAVSMGLSDLVPVIAASHPAAKRIGQDTVQEFDFASLQTVVSHDTSTTNVAGNAGLSLNSTRILYVQNMDQKVQAILAGLGIGHLPRYRIRQYLQDAQLIELPLEADNPECFIAWEITNKGKALSVIAKALSLAKW